MFYNIAFYSLNLQKLKGVKRIYELKTEGKIRKINILIEILHKIEEKRGDGI